MEEWKIYKLKEIGEIVGGATPSTKNPSNYDGPIPWITPKDLSNSNERYIFNGERSITNDGYMSCSCKLLPKGTVLFSSRAPIGYVAIAAAPMCTNQGFKSFIPNSKVDSLFMFYLMKYRKDDIANLGSGTTFIEVSGSVMKEFEVKVPNLDTQKRIANVLSSLDDKIELNNRINHNLEEQAQALYKSWFVDFEPFKDGKFIESELGMIPEGWRVVTMGEVTTEIRTKVGNRTGIKVLSPINTGKLALSEEYFTKQVFSNSIAKYILVEPNSFAYNPARVNIGSIGMNEFPFDGCVSPVYVVFRCEDEYEYLFDFFRKGERFKTEVITRSIGGVRQTLAYKDFSMIKMVYPPAHIIRNFNSIYHTFYRKINDLENQNKKISELRDSILPKLMSGELKINEIDC